MEPATFKSNEPLFDNMLGFISIGDQTYKSCWIKETTGLGAYLTAIDTDGIAEEFILYSFSFKEAQLCKVTWQKGRSIGAWFDSDAAPDCTER